MTRVLCAPEAHFMANHHLEVIVNSFTMGEIIIDGTQCPGDLIKPLQKVPICPTRYLCKNGNYLQQGRFVKGPGMIIFAFSMILICFFFFDGASLRTLGRYERSEKGFQTVPLPSRHL